MISPLRLTLCLVLAAFLISNSLVLGLRGALYRSGRSAMMPNGYQEFLRFGRAPRVARASGGFFTTHDQFDPDAESKTIDADDGLTLRYGK
ncbi:hypothetical protein L596_027338 [Steinernema carpocapsae]|uniref:Uncharacterized protein n=1 Tax=Steinernema carpocapsae TaxID=34508 RepID=A0A4U5M426_STECR|nr:hypothetical protein L596_027338 [Steinernema carpocapsae]